MGQQDEEEFDLADDNFDSEFELEEELDEPEFVDPFAVKKDLRNHNFW